jgi:iron complex transport system permease protein
MKPLTPKRLVRICALLGLLLFAAMVLSLRLGAVPVSFTDLAVGLGKSLVGAGEQAPSDYRMIISEIRLPRVLLGILVGASLSVAGAAFQALLRNPLGDPYVLGISSGAAVGALFSLILIPNSSLATLLLAFVGAGVTGAAVYFLGLRGGQLDSYTLVLAGIICASFLSAVVIFLMTTLSGPGFRGVAFWLMGDLSTPRPVAHGWFFLILAAAVAAIYTTAADLNLMLNGEQEALHLGVDVTRVKLVVYISAALLTGLAVSVAGAVGYVGILVPHIMRQFYGSDYRVLLPVTAIGGAIAIVLADTVARTLVYPTELPVGAITAAAGAPVFLYLLRRRLL